MSITQIILTYRRENGPVLLLLPEEEVIPEPPGIYSGQITSKLKPRKVSNVAERIPFIITGSMRMMVIRGILWITLSESIFGKD